MKKLTIICLTLMHFMIWSQTATENYIKSTQPTEAVKDQQSLDNLPANNKRSSIKYFDGLGRPSQQIIHRNSPNYKDVLSFTIYDNTGRSTTNYLPYSANQANLQYHSDPVNDQLSFYANTARVAQTAYPFSQVDLEDSPLQRVLEESAPGEDWQFGEGHTQQTTYETNSSNEVRLWQSSQGNITSQGFYPVSELHKVILNNEDGFENIVFTNKTGKVILEKKQITKNPNTYTETYYVYDGFYRLVSVIPPQAYADMVNYDVNQEVPNQVYRYVYDEHQRLIEKKLPHVGWQYIVYDKLNRPILNQDSQQHTDGKWSFIKYDKLGREILTGIVSDVRGRSSMQTAADLTTFVFEERTASNFSTQHGYTNQAFPNSSNLDIHTVQYYDDYDFNNDGTDDVNFVAPPSGFTVTTPSGITVGLLTGAKVKILDNGNAYLSSSQWYDEKARLIQNKSENYLGGNDIIHSEYDFIDQLVLQTRVHDDGSNPAITIRERHIYDHAGRLRQTFHKINNQAEILYTENKYNSLGQLIDKKLHATNAGAPQFLQSIDYAHNIRGWLTHINNSSLNDDEYVQNQADPGAILGFDISKLEFKVHEVNDENLGGRFLELWVSDESDMRVEGDINTELYKNDGAATLMIMNYPEEGDNESISIYNSLLNIREQNFILNYEGEVLSIDNETRIETLQEDIYNDVFTVLENSEFTDENAIKKLQSQVFNYVTGKAGHVLEVNLAPFSSKYLQYYFSEKNNHQLFMTVWDATQSQSHEIFIMDKTVNNIAEYNYLLDLTNLPNKTITLIVDFGLANLYEGMSTVDAVNECKSYQKGIINAYSITNTTVLEKMDDFAINFALNEFGNTYFNDDANDLWGMELKFNTRTSGNNGYPLGTTKSYLPQVSEMVWQSVGDKKKRAYGYQYDGLKRITSASYKAFNSNSQSWTDEVGRYNVSQLSYDLNGNIQNLQRNGFISGTINQNAVFGLMDDLNYSYTGDQLTDVSDATSLAYQNDFLDGNTSGADYSYDLNGNLTSDLNKGIIQITHNHLNLPSTVDNGNGETVSYIYDALGNKLKKEFNNYGVKTSTYYTAFGNYSASGSNQPTLDFIFAPEGRLVNDNGLFRYEYYLKDHLGNVRVGFSDYNNNDKVDASEITQQHNYYPFGLEHKGTFYGTPTQTNFPYFYNGKEVQTELSLNWFDFGARNYNAQIARWFNTDPLSEKFYSQSTYNYVENNPLTNIDPDGRESLESVGRNARAQVARYYMVTGMKAYYQSEYGIPANAKMGLNQRAQAANLIDQGFDADMAMDLAIGFSNSYTKQIKQMYNWNMGTSSDYQGPQASDLYKPIKMLTGYDAVVGFVEAYENGDKKGMFIHGADLMQRTLGLASMGIQTIRTQKSLPTQVHHFATNKNSVYTKKMQDIADMFGLDLDGAWNKQAMPHQGRHPNEYHDFVLDGMKQAAAAAKAVNGTMQEMQNKFLGTFNKLVKQPVIQNPQLLRKTGWQ